tara:strand:- start:2718 stop:3566 length:849 start_codon:yes stop_codon:yes gene_type:complete
MIILATLNRLESSPIEYADNNALLEKRADIYGGNNFYFGFNSSKMNFIDILNQYHQIAIKYFSTLTILRRGNDHAEICLYHINPSDQKLSLLASIKSDNKEAIMAICPFSFAKDPFFCPTDPPQRVFKTIQNILLNIIKSPLIVDMARLKELSAALKETKDFNLVSIQQTDGSELSQMSNNAPPSSSTTIANYLPILDNDDITPAQIADINKNQITVRRLHDSLERIEVIDATSDDNNHSVMSIYKFKQPELFEQITANMEDKNKLSQLISNLSTPTAQIKP